MRAILFFENVVHIVPSKYQYPVVPSVWYTINPFAGEEIDSRWLEVILGISIPLLVLVISSEADDAGVVVPIPTCAVSVCDVISKINR
jgi:hypothetical protein